MFLIKTYVAPSPIDGLGVFTAVPVKKGEIVWKFDPNFDRTYTIEQVESLPLPAREHVFKCGFLDKRRKLYFLGIDYDIFTNHSNEPSLIEIAAPDIGKESTESLAASRDLSAGEELTQDYYEYDDEKDIEWKLSKD